MNAKLVQEWDTTTHIAFTIALIFTVIACLFSFNSMLHQLRRYRRPHLQRHILRIFWMVPIYAVSSLLSLRNTYAAEYIEAFRDLYEAVVIYIFFQLLVEFLGGERAIHSLLQNRPPTPHMFPVSFFVRDFDVARPITFLYLKRGILQFVLLKPVFALSTLLLKKYDTFQEGYIALTSPYVWVSFLYNISVSVSMYCLLAFFRTCVTDLKPFRPLPKFLCVKSVIFFSFWQGIIISIFVYTGIIHEAGNYSADNISTAIQNFLICMEMAIAGWAHDVAFSPRDYAPAPGLRSGRVSFKYAVRDAFGVSDLISDVRHTLCGTRFFAQTATDQLLDQFQYARTNGWMQVLLNRFGYRRRFTSSPISSLSSAASGETDALLPPAPVSANVTGDLFLDPEDEAIYDTVQCACPRGDSRYPVVEDEFDPQDFFDPILPALSSTNTTSQSLLPYHVLDTPSSHVFSPASLRRTVQPGPAPIERTPL